MQKKYLKTGSPVKKACRWIGTAALAAALLTGCGNVVEDVPSDAGNSVSADLSVSDTAYASDLLKGSSSDASAKDAGPNVVVTRFSYESASPTSSYNPYVTQYFDTLTVSNQDVYPALTKAIRSYSKSLKDGEVSKRSHLLSDAKADYKKNTSSFVTYQDKHEILIKRCDEQFLSFLTVTRRTHGGSTEYNAWEGINYNVKTGKVVLISDLVTETAGLKAVLKDLLTQRLGAEHVDEIEETLSSVFSDAVAADLEFTIDPQGITVYMDFPPAYSIAGLEKVFVSKKDYPDLFTDTFKEATGSWAMNYNGGMNAAYVENGKTIQLSVMEIPDPKDPATIKKVRITLNGKKKTYTLYVYSLRPVLMQDKSGNTFLYLQTGGDNDWQTLYIINLTGGTIKKTGSQNGRAINRTINTASWDYEKNGEPVGMLENPDYFLLEERSQLLSTYDMARPYRIGSKGKPKALQSWYTIEDRLKLKTKTALTLYKVNTKTHKKGKTKVTVSKGSKLLLKYTDAKTYVDAKLSDGRIVRIPVKDPGTADGTQTVNGKNIEKVFSGIRFAG